MWLVGELQLSVYKLVTIYYVSNSNIPWILMGELFPLPAKGLYFIK